MERTVSLQEVLFGYPITCQATVLDDGLSILLTGGSRTHVGAVSICRTGEVPDTCCFPGHKDHVLSEAWAKALSERHEGTICVACGIHYDHATGQQIQEILAAADRLLARLLAALS